MYVLRLLVSLLLLPYFLCPGQAFGQVAVEKKSSEMLYQMILRTAEKKTAQILKKIPAGNLMVVQAEKGEAVKNEIVKRMKTLAIASNAEVAEFKRELLKLNERELGTMRAELQGYLNAMTEKEIAELAQLLRRNPAYATAVMEYDSAYTNVEKLRVLQGALMQDLGFLRSVYNKKIGMASRNDLGKDLEKNLAVFRRDQAQKADTKKILQISLLVLAGVALATWGISAAVYGGRLNRATDEREAKLTQLKNELEAQYQTYKAELTQRELDYLNANGYVRTLCGIYSQPDSILCNRYGYQLFSGTKQCSIYCMKNIQTGKETLHEPAVCTSAFIPGDCYDPSEYWRAYDRGENDGYDDGYYDGSSDGDDDGSWDGYYDGQDDGYDDGYSDGYDDGYADGYDAGEADSEGKRLKSFVPYQQSEAYLKGFKDGFEQYQILFLNY